MSVLSILGVIVGIFAGLANLLFASLRRDRPLVLAVRLVAALLGFGGAIGIIMVHLPTETDSTLYQAIGLFLFVGLTLMLPASIDRNTAPPEVEPETHTTGKLSGQAGVTIANQNDEWVN